MPQISIIVPVYKVERYIEKCVHSILKQTFAGFELILVDDGSPDDCGKICDDFALKDHRVKVIHKPNGGLSSARNAGIQAAKGDYIAFVDSDDHVHHQMYEILYNTALIHGSDLVVCDYLRVREDQVFAPTNLKSVINVQHFTNLDALHQLCFPQAEEGMSGRDKWNWTIVCNKLFKRSLFDDIRFKEGRIFEDEFITHRILYNSPKITFVSGKLYYYVQRSNSILNSPFTVKKFDKVYALKDRAEFFKEKNQRQLYHMALKSFVDAFFWYYDTACSKLSDPHHEDIKKLKRTMDQSLMVALLNPLMNWKQKVFLLLFIIHPYIYQLYQHVRKVKI